MTVRSKLRDAARFLAVRQKYQLAWFDAARRFYKLTSLRQFSPTEVFLLGLMDKKLDDPALDRFVSKEAMLGRQHDLNPREAFPLTEDKLVFYQHCVQHCLPTPRVLGAWRTGNALPPDVPLATDVHQWQDLCCALPIDDLVLKPVSGVHGEGVMLLHREGSLFRDHEGRMRSAGDLLAVMQASGYGAWMFQERLRAHSDLAALSGSNFVQTARVVTYVDGEGQAKVVFAWLRLIGARAVFDNFNFGEAGNLVATLDLDSATVRYALGRNDDGFGIRTIDLHPFTGKTFKGFAVPHGRLLFDVAERAASCFAPLRTIGWDVAITPTGVTLIEGNVTWDPLPTFEDLGAVAAAMT